MEHQVNNLCKQLYIQLRTIGQLSHFLKKESIQILVSAFIFSRLDYCNSLLANMPKTQLDRLQRIQNQAARIITKTSIKEHVTPIFKQLHWLPVSARIEFKIATLCHKCLNSNAPSYLSELLQKYEPTRTLRSADKNLLITKPAKL